jgi:hypothetical protein
VLLAFFNPSLLLFFFFISFGDAGALFSPPAAFAVAVNPAPTFLNSSGSVATPILQAQERLCPDS